MGEEGDTRRPDEGRGLRDEYPRISGPGISAGAGALWGVLGYTVLWNGAPFGVDRRFVESVGGTLLLLPVRIALWGLRMAERMAGRSFDLADNNWWIGVLAAAIGAGMCWVLFVAARAFVRALPARRG